MSSLKQKEAFDFISEIVDQKYCTFDFQKISLMSLFLDSLFPSACCKLCSKNTVFIITDYLFYYAHITMVGLKK